jgi:hypothetical protein
VYTAALVGRSQRTWFGSFQINQRLIHEYRVAAALAKLANAPPLEGA